MTSRRVLPALALALVGLAGPAYAGGHVSPNGGGHGGGGGGHKTTTPLTYDVSYPQCSSRLPSPIEGAIVGVNDGIVYSANPCLADEYAWAKTGTTYAPAFYANTADPGPAVSHKWPTGATSPRTCDGSDSLDCSYDYGYLAAQDSFADAVAGTPAGVAATSAWWLDVETGNSWESLESQYGYGPTASSYANDFAALQGAQDALAAEGVPSVGFYSTSYQWTQITGSTGQFPTNPSWVAGTGSLSTAQSNCTSVGFSGGAVAWAQYYANGLDADYPCPTGA